MSSFQFWLLACLCWKLVHGLNCTNVTCTTSEAFLPLPSLDSFLSLDVVTGLVNKHVTMLIGFPITHGVRASPAGYTSGQITTDSDSAGTLALAFNDTFYTHKWYPSVGDAVPNDSAYFDAQCTMTAASVTSWNCTTYSMTVSPGYSGGTPYSHVATVQTDTAVNISQSLYTIIALPLTVAPALRNATTTSTPATTSFSPTRTYSVSTQTISYSATTTTGGAGISFKIWTLLPFLACAATCFLTST